MTERSRSLGAAGGVVGPVAFITAWAVLGSTQPYYSPIADPISRLAAIDAPTSVAMTGGFLAFAAGALLCARGLRVALPGPTALNRSTRRCCQHRNRCDVDRGVTGACRHSASLSS